MMSNKSKLILLLLLLVSTANKAQKIISTTAKDRWQAGKIKVVKEAPSSAVNITIYPDSLLQRVSGFGASFSELGWDALQHLDSKACEQVMASLFSADGLNMAYGRLPIGSNDLSFAYYSYNDVKDDYTMRNFSIDRDRYILIPFVKAALKHHPNLIFWASPWTPPSWMKINEHYSLRSSGINGTAVGHNMLDSAGTVVRNVTGFNMKESNLKAYALYFSKYIKAYRQEGIHIKIVMPQNEVQWEPCWESCTWHPEDLNIFVNKYLGPQFDRDSLDTKIWLGTINYPDPRYVRRYFEQDSARTYLKGIGVQWTGMRALPVIHKEHPNLEYMQTEDMCGEGENDWTSLENTWKSMVHCFNNGVGSYMYWNMVLALDGKSSFGWKQNSLILIDCKNKKPIYTDEYYLMKHLSSFIQPGSVMLHSLGDGNTLVFRNEKGKIVIVTYNASAKDKAYTYRVDSKLFAVTIKGKSINTIP